MLINAQNIVNKIALQFPNAQGELLSGLLEQPYDPSGPMVVFAHCFTCSKNIGAATRISRALVEKGFSVFRFDFTGLGNSEGDFANSNFSSNSEDLVVACNYLEERYTAPSVLIGHSLGGAAVLQAVNQIKSCKALVTIGAPSDPFHVSHLFKENIEEIEQNGLAQVDLAGRLFTVKKQFLLDIKNANLLDKVKKNRRPLLIFHSPQDEIVSINHAREIYEAAFHPKSFISLHGADHLVSNKADSDYIAETTASWLSRYLDKKEDGDKPATDSKNRSVRVSEIAKYTQQVETGRHVFYSDEPKSLGGQDLGPTPMELMSSALAACTSITLRMYCEHKDLDVDKINVKVDRKKLAELGDENKTSKKMIDQFDIEIEIIGDIDSSVKNRMLKIASRCPVHQTLKSTPLFNTYLKES